MESEGYCDAGIHYIGDADECWRCAEWERQQMVSRMYYAAADAHCLLWYLQRKLWQEGESESEGEVKLRGLLEDRDG